MWVGYGATILDGVHIGQGAVIGARAVVTRDIEPYAIVGGCTARIIRKRFDDKTINRLFKIDYSLIDDEFVRDHRAELVDGPVTHEYIEKIIADLENKRSNKR